LQFFNPADPVEGFSFQGRISEDFKLSSGTWVRVGPLRARLLARLGDLAQDVVIAGHDRECVTALVFPLIDACRMLIGPNTGNAGQAFRPGESTPRDVLRHPAVVERFRDLLVSFADDHPGSSTAVRRAILLEEPPAIDAQETTEK